MTLAPGPPSLHLCNPDAFDVRSLSGENLHLAYPHVKVFGEKFAQGAIGLAFLGRSRDFDLIGSVRHEANQLGL